MSSLSARIAEAKQEFKLHLNADEEPLWFDGFFLVVTDSRVLSFRISGENLLTSGGDLSDSYVLRLSLPLGLVAGVTASPKNSLLGSGLKFSLQDGSTEFVGCPIAVESVDELLLVIEKAQLNPSLNDSQFEIVKHEKGVPGRVQRLREREESSAALESKYGQELITAGFASWTITIFANGYVRVSALLGLVAGEIEELHAISGGTDITKKTGVGRAAGAVLTSGLNLVSPNQRGNVYLTISTSRDTYALSSQNPTSTSIANMQALVSAGTGVLDRVEARRRVKNGSEQSTQPTDLSTQLRNLAELRSSGMLTEEEFAKAKTKLLEG